VNLLRTNVSTIFPCTKLRTKETSQEEGRKSTTQKLTSYPCVNSLRQMGGEIDAK
jgi:hypothetical protein